MTNRPEIDSASRLFVRESGSDTAPTIVFLHGGGIGGWMWTSQVERLPDYHCLLPDMPEHGRSLHVQPFTIDDAVARIADLIRTRAHNAKAHLVGLSLGAQVTVALLSAFPGLVDRAVISSALLRPLPGLWMYRPGLLAAMFRWGVVPFQKNKGFVRLNMKWSAGLPETNFNDFQDDFRLTTPQSFAHYMTENLNFRLPSGLDRVSVPALIVVGEHEYTPMHQSARDLIKSLPNAQARMVSFSQRAAEEHNWVMHKPDLFASMTRAWIEGKPLPADLKTLA